MIVVHFFTRTTRGKTYVMADSSATDGTDPAFSSPVAMFEAEPGETRARWISRAKKLIAIKYPKARLRVLRPSASRPTPTQIFDIAVEVDKPPEKPMGLIGRIKEIMKR